MPLVLQNPHLSAAAMARAMGQACEAGRTAFLAGRLPRRAKASASSPKQGLVGH
jgi:thiazole synthase